MAKKVEKNDKLEEALAEIEKKYGKGIIMDLTANSILDVPVISTGVISIDKALGVFGVPKGRIIEIFGDSAGGKTTLCLSIVAQAQKEGMCAWFDVEQKMNLTWAKINGVDLSANKFKISQIGVCENVLECLQILVESGSFKVIVVDSVAAMPTKAEMEGDYGDATIGVQAKLLSSAMRKLVEVVAKTNTILIFINQIRDKIKLGFAGGFGDNFITCGGKAIPFYATVRIKATKIKQLTVGTGAETKSIGSEHQIKVVKNQVAPPFLKANFKIYNTEGISELAQILDYAIDLKVVKKEGAWFSFENKNLAQGKSKVRLLLKKETELYNKIKTLTLDKLKKQEVAESEPDDEDEDKD